MSTESNGTILNSIYRNRIGEPDTNDEVSGYWVFILGIVVGTLGVLLFLPSESAVGASGVTLREVSIILMAAGLSMLLAGPTIRLPLASWVNKVVYLGLVVSFVALAWFTVVFPKEWDVLTGNQPVIFLYVVGLGLIVLGGIFGSLVAGRAREELAASRSRAADLEAELDEVRGERDDLRDELERSRSEPQTSDDARSDLEDENERLRGQLESLHASQAQFELFEDRGDQWRWRLRHRNGNIIADSSQGYTRKHNAKKGLASVRRDALGATLLEIEPDPEDNESGEEALEETPLLPEAPEKSNAEFEVYEDSGGKYRWRLVHDNGNIVADSGEGYASKRGAKRGIESVKENAGPASYLQFDPTSFEIYRDNAGEWRWRLVHKNGNILAAASEGYTRRRDAKRSVDRIREEFGDADEGFEVYEDNRGEFRWRFRANNEEIVATSGEGYNSQSEATRAVERVQRYAPEADALDVGLAAFEVYKDEADEWRWRLRHRNGNVIADGGEGYASRHGTHDAIEGVKRNAPEAPVNEA